jgi:hypothetical protein
MKRNIYLSMMVVGLVSSQLVFADDETSSSKDKSQSDSTSAASQEKDSSRFRGAGERSEKGTKVSLDQLPESVQKTIRAEAGDAKVENVRKMTKHGQTCYQATFDKENMKGKLTVAEDGSLLQYQQAEDLALVAAAPAVSRTDTKLTDLPEDVQKAIKEQAGSNPVGDISKNSEGGKTMYHAAFNEGGARTDLIVGEDGKVVAKSEETALFVAPLENAQTLALSSAPEPVQKAVRHYAGSTAEVTDIDKGTWNGKTAYKITVEKNGSPRSLVISENGELLGRETNTGAPATAERGNEQEHESSRNETEKHQPKD